MKICIIVDDYLPDSKKVAGKMMHEIAIEFLSRGHDVTVVTPYTDLKQKIKVTKLDGVTVCRFKSGKIKNVSKLKRTINETLLGYRAWRACKCYFNENPHDFIIYYSPTIFWGTLIRRLKDIWGASSYLILRDFYPQMFIDEGLIHKQACMENDKEVGTFNNDQQCFDNSMKLWFQSFFMLQEEGYDMRQADYIAYQEAELQYENCHNVISRKKPIDKRLKSRQL